jgi:hypothetical protein
MVVEEMQNNRPKQVYGGVQNSGGGGGGTGSTGNKAGGSGGSGIVIVKELNKASGSWPLRAQFSSQKQGTWPYIFNTVSFDYLVVAGGGAGGTGWRWWRSRRI